MENLTQSHLSTSYQPQLNWENLIAAIALRIRATLDLPTILQTTANEVRQLLGCDRVLLYQFAPDWSGQVVVESVAELRWSLLDQVVRDTCFEACWLEPYHEGKYAAIADVATANLSSCYADFLHNFEIKANLVIPLLCEAHLWGLLVAHNCSTSRQWQPEEISGLQQIAVHVGIAIYQASLLEQLQASKVSLETQVESRTFDLARLAAIVEYSQDAIISKTPAGIIISWNQAAENLLGYSAQNVIGQHVSMLIPLDRQDEELQILQAVHQGERVETYETKRLHQNGNLVDVDLTVSPIRDDKGNVIGASKILRDIRDRKQVELALQQSEARFQHLIAHVPSMIYSIVHPKNAPTYFEYISSALIDISEITPEQVYADISLLFRQWHPEDVAGWDAISRQSLANLEPFSFEWRIITPSGKLKWLNIYASVECRQNGDVARYGVVSDVSDRKQIELALQQSEEKYRHLINNLHAGFVVHAADTSIVLCNAKACQLLGLTQDQILGKTAIDPAWHFLHEDGSVMPLKEYPVNQVLRSSLPLRNYVLGINHSDQTQVWLLVNAFPEFDDNQQIRQVAITFIDISDRKQTEAELEKISERLDLSLKSGGIGCWDWDISQNIILWDDRMYELYGITKQSDSVVYDIWANSVHPDDRVNTETLLQKAILGQAEYDTEFRVIHPDRSIHFIKAYGTVAHDAQGKPTSMIGINFDISDRKQAELDLKLVNQQLSDRLAEINQRHAEMVTLSEISDFLQACLTVEEACNALSKLIAPLFPNCAGGVFITNTSRNRVEMMSSWGESLHSEDSFLPKDCWALRRGKLHFHADNGVSCNHIPANQAIAETLCIPMIAQGETIGLFYLSTNTANALPKSKQQIARTLAEQVGLAIANLRLQETLQQQSIRDPLTGLFNRRYLEESLSQELSRAQRQQHQIGVIMIDIDHFKKFNDTYGHDAGDYVLQAVATLLKKYVRGSDIACRYGGEELILVLPDSSLELANKRAEEIREAIAQVSLNYNSQRLGSLTASFGVASFPQHGATGSAVMQSADAALYRAKAAGRNQVLAAP